MKVQPLHPVSRARSDAATPSTAAGFGDALSLAVLGLPDKVEGTDAEALKGETQDAADPLQAAWIPDSSAVHPAIPQKIDTAPFNAGTPDPRSAGVEGNGASAPDPATLTTREPGSDARGLRWGAVQPGGARIDFHALPLGRQSGSRGVPPPTDARVEGAAQAGEARLVPPHSPSEGRPEAAPTPARASNPSPRTGPTAPVAPAEALPDARTDATTADSTASGRALDRALSPAELTRAEAADTSEAEPVADEHLDGVSRTPTPTRPALTEVDPTLADADGAPEATPREARPTATAPTPEARPQPAPEEAPLPPGRKDDGVVRIHLDPDVAVEVVAEGDAVDVTLEGRAEHTADLEDAGAELEEALAEGGFDLGHFRRREGRGAPATFLHRGRGADAAPSDSPEGPRRIRRGTLIDILA